MRIVNKFKAITKIFEFEAAHCLPFHQGACQFLHGHTYKLEVTLYGKQDENGIIMDFSELKRIVNEEVIKEFDHAYINDKMDCNPTAENMLDWIWNKLEKAGVSNLYVLRLWETSTSFAEMFGVLELPGD